MGFPGIACKHCFGFSHRGQFYPKTESLLLNGYMEYLLNQHLSECPKCPTEIKEKASQSILSKRTNRNWDGRKVFSHRLWCRIHNNVSDQELCGQGNNNIIKPQAVVTDDKLVNKMTTRRQYITIHVILYPIIYTDDNNNKYKSMEPNK